MAITMDGRRPGHTGQPAAVARIGRRAQAFVAARRHSRLISVLRVLCPLTAVVVFLAYVGAVFLNWQMTAGKFKVGGVEITADDLTMKDPSYFDTTNDGRYEVRAKRAIVSFGQNKNKPINLVDVSGEMVKKSGEITRLKAKHGLFDNPKGELELFDGIEIDGDGGVMARLSRAMIYSKEGKVVSTEPVSANMAAGSVQAASMTMLTKTKLVQFRGSVSVRLLPQQGSGIGGNGKDARQPVDVRSEELDIDDAAKTAHFRGKVVAVQGETMMQAPYLMVKYEGKAAGALGAAAPVPAHPETGAATKDGGARVTFIWARNGVEITSGNDRHVVSELADFDIAGDTALFSGNVVVTQEQNVLKGGRLTVDRKAGRTHLETPGQGGRISANFTPPASANAARSAKKGAAAAAEAAQSAIMGSFKADRNVPMYVEASTLDLYDASNKATFNGNVSARQGDLLLRTSLLNAYYSGKSGLSLSDAGGAAPAGAKGDKAEKGEKGEITRLEARQSVILTSKEQSATSEWADFDVKGNTALLGGGVVVDRAVEGAEDPAKRNIVMGDRLRVDLTTGMYHIEADPASAANAEPPRKALPLPPGAKATATSKPPSPAVAAKAGPPPSDDKFKACQPGRQCALFFPQHIKEKALDAAKGAAPGAEEP